MSYNRAALTQYSHICKYWKTQQYTRICLLLAPQMCRVANIFISFCYWKYMNMCVCVFPAAGNFNFILLMQAHSHACRRVERERALLIFANTECRLIKCWQWLNVAPATFRFEQQPDKQLNQREKHAAASSGGKCATKQPSAWIRDEIMRTW